jgi:hypothetical protein
MKSGRVIRSFDARDGRRVVLRTLKWDDLKDCLEFINSLVDEKANILRDQKVTKEAEIEWLAKALSLWNWRRSFIWLLRLTGKWWQVPN